MSPRRPATLDCIRIEPLLGKGGDNLFRTELLGALCQVCDINEALTRIAECTPAKV